MASAPDIQAAPYPAYPQYGAYGALRGGLGDALRYILSVVRRNLWLIAAVIAVVVAAALVWTMLQTPRYTAVTTVQIDDQTASVLGEDLEDAVIEDSGWDIDRFLNTQLEVLRSRELAERVARRLELFGDEAFLAAMEVPPPADGLPERLRQDQVVGLLQAGLGVDLPRNSRVARISFDSTDPEMSARVANGFAEEFIQASLRRRFDKSAYARNFVAEQLDEARAQLEASERELNAYARDAGLIRAREPGISDDSSNRASSVTSSSLLQLNEAANRAQADRVAAEARWRAESNTPLLSSETVLADPTVQSLMQQRAARRAELQSARERYLDDHPQVRELTSQIAEIERQLNAAARNVRNGIRARYTAAREAESQLRGQVGRLERETLAEQDRSVRYNTLAREADTNRSIYDGLLERYRELNASAGVAASNISIIDPADPPLGPSSPNVMRNLLLALILGTAIAGVAVFLRDQLDDRIRVPEDIDAKFGIPLLGVVPRVPGNEEVGTAMEDPKSSVAEAYNSLRGSLLHATREGLPKILLITSSQPTEGKSTTSWATAASLARMGRRVVLVDADMRRPSIHRRAGIANERGLSDLLTSDAAPGDFVSATSTEGLVVLPSGKQPPSPTELLTGPRMALLLERLGEEYDAVVVDSPPVLGLADAPALAAISDGVAFVVESNRGGRGALKSALRRLRAVNANVLGAVLTKFDPQRAGHGYSAYYGYDYYRYESGAEKA